MNPSDCVKLRRLDVGQELIDLLIGQQAALNHSPAHPLDRHPIDLADGVITSGQGPSWGERGAWHVPKKELVCCLQGLLQSRRLQVAALPERTLLMQEMQSFRVKITAAANETFGAWRERDHDDLVLAVALAAWWGERHGSLPGKRPACRY